MTRLHTPFLIGMLALLISSPVFALTGRVINQTLNRPEPDVEVSYILHETGDVTVMRDTTDSKGQFILDVPSDPGAEPPPMLFARYNGIDYPGNPAPAGDTVDIPVFETTESDTPYPYLHTTSSSTPRLAQPHTSSSYTTTATAPTSQAATTVTAWKYPCPTA